mgnify:CR=1 FL=1
MNSIFDHIQPNLDILFVGFNPSIRSGETGHHFANPTNRFWRVIYQAGFTDRLLTPAQWPLLADYGCGNMVLVQRMTVAASELTREELRLGGEVVKNKIKQYQPRALAVLGKQAYEIAFRQNKVNWGRQDLRIGATEVWVLPHPSGLNRATLTELTEHYRQLALALDTSST